MAFLNEQGLAILWSHILDKLNKKISLPEEGSSYKQLVTDSNGEAVWEERLAYTRLETVTILPEKTYTTPQAQIYADYTLIENEIYTITYNGNTYSSPASIHGQYGICLGNLSLINQGSDTGEPFVLFMLAPNKVGFAIFKDSSSSRTISVTGPTEKNTLVNSKYLPGNLSAGEGFNSAVICSAEHTSATGSFSFAHGFDTAASGSSSFAEGYFSKARGDYSHAEGNSTIASGEAQHAQGRRNIEDTENKYAHIVGNGTANNARSNAHTLDWSGNAWFSGDVYTGSTSGTNKDDGSKKLSTEEYVDTALQNLIIISDTEPTVQEGKIWLKPVE